MLTALISLLQSTLTEKAKSRPDMQQALKLLKHGHKQTKKFAQARPVDASGLVSYAALCQIRDSITEGPTQEILLMAFLTATAPRVLDLHACMTFEKEPNQQQLRHHTGTYLVLPKSGSNKACVVYRSMDSKPTRLLLPASLGDLVRKSLADRPRQYLFAHCKTTCNEPQPYTQRSFAAWCSRTLKRLTGSPDATVALAQKAFVSHYLANPQTAKGAASLAAALGMTVTQLRKQARTVTDAVDVPPKNPT